MYVIISQSPEGVTEALVCECALLSPLRGFGILDDAYRGLPAPAKILMALRA